MKQKSRIVCNATIYLKPPELRVEEVKEETCSAGEERDVWVLHRKYKENHLRDGP